MFAGEMIQHLLVWSHPNSCINHKLDAMPTSHQKRCTPLNLCYGLMSYTVAGLGSWMIGSSFNCEMH